MKGIILAGGSGSRLYPVTRAISKQLVPIYDKPMIYYPLSVLMLAEIREILIITTREDQESFKRLLGDGHSWGLDFHYAIQERPAGLAQALTIAEKFLEGGPSSLVLGDNIFYGQGFSVKLVEIVKQTKARGGATVFANQVVDPERYGVVEFDKAGKAQSLEEKPSKPRSNFAVTGLYFYDAKAPQLAASLKPSPRGELEITDLNRLYLEQQALHVDFLGRGFAWLDTGTHESMLQASNFIEAVQSRQGMKISCPEEIAFFKGWIDAKALEQLASPMAKNEYGRYLLRLAERGI